MSNTVTNTKKKPTGKIKVERHWDDGGGYTDEFEMDAYDASIKEDAISIMPNVKRFDCYSTGLITTEKLQQLRKDMPDSLFAANYELKHIADTDALFREPRFEADEQMIYGGVAHIDAAYGGEDYTAYTILRELEDGSIIGFGKLWRKHVDQCLPEIRLLHEMYRAGSISCETNADKSYLAKEMRAQGFFVRTYAEKMNKFIKISTYLRKGWSDIRWIEATDPEYISQILDYTENAQHDDAPDSAASLYVGYDEAGEFTLQKIKPHLYNSGKGDWSDQTVEFTFNRNVMMNDSEMIANIKSSIGLLSTETLLAMHPYVDDVEAELEQIQEEKNQIVDDMGFMRAPSKKDPEDVIIDDE